MTLLGFFVILDIYSNKTRHMVTRLNENEMRSMLMEELTKGEVTTMIASKLGDNLNSREFKKKVKELAAEVVNEIFRILWQRSSFWKSSVTN